MSSYDLSAFDSPNFPPLVKGENLIYITECKTDTWYLVGIDIVVNWNDVIRQTALRKFRAHKSR